MAVMDAVFPIRGGRLPLDHGYQLFSALSRKLPLIHERPGLGIFALGGSPTTAGTLDVASGVLRLRAPAELFGHLLALTGCTLEIAGTTLQLGALTAYPLRPVPSLSSRLVTIKGFMDEPAFRDALSRQLLKLDCSGDVRIGRRRVLTIAGKRVVGFAVAMDRLGTHASIRLQEAGIGGRRHMGCGLFVPTQPPRMLAKASTA